MWRPHLRLSITEYTQHSILVNKGLLFTCNDSGCVLSSLSKNGLIYGNYNQPQPDHVKKMLYFYTHQVPINPNITKKIKIPAMQEYLEVKNQ